jgi:hypothetical protein
MNRTAKAVVALMAALLALMSTSNTASASTLTNSTPSAVSDCDTGQRFFGSGENKLENGELLVGVCVDDSGWVVKRINVSYQKKQGQGANLSMYWEFVDSYGDASNAGWNSTGPSFNASAGNTYPQSWRGSTRRPQDLYCVRGVLHDNIGGSTWTTRVVC